MADSKRYSEREVAEILRLATEQQASVSDGMTLAEIKSLAADLGIDINAIDSASQVVDTGSTERHADGTKFEYARSFRGEVSDEAWEAIIAKMRRQTGVQGTVDQRGSTREWTGLGELRNTYLTATSKNGVTRFHLTTDTNGFKAFMWIISFVPLFLGAAILGSIIKKGGAPEILIPIYAALALVTVLLSMRAIAKRKDESREYEKVIDEFETYIQPPSEVTNKQTTQETEPLQIRLGEQP